MVAKKPLTIAERKKKIVLVTAIVIAVLCLVPPWNYHYSSTTKDVGYGLLIAPPHAHGYDGNAIDLVRLAVECFAAAVVGGALFYGVKE